MDLASSSHRYHVTKRLHRHGHKQTGSSERCQKRLLYIVRVISTICMLTGVTTIVLGSFLVVFAFGEPRFTFSTGLPLMIGIMDLLGSFILCCISLTGSKFRKYTSPHQCKWQCALLYFCHFGVLLLGTTSLVLTFSLRHVKFSLTTDPTSAIFPLALASTIFITANLFGVVCNLIVCCVYKHRFGKRYFPGYSDSRQHNGYIEQEVAYRLMLLSNLLTRFAGGHVTLPQQAEVTSSAVNPKSQPSVDRKGYYMWEPL